ncbi:AAA family ATPase, partial [uncultured Hyphomicrobium sp.]|uniref:AAA family ATPase n=1 Tax=uncultured Hyphomicrobium sp. TaxID=194373 RepID=UPI0025E56DA1
MRTPPPSQPAGPPAVLPDASWPPGVTPTEQYAAAVDYVREADGHLFVTGRAGTGKSTLLRALKATLDHELVAGTSPAAPLVCHVLPAQPRLTAALPLRHAALGLRSGSTVTVP